MASIYINETLLKVRVNIVLQEEIKHRLFACANDEKIAKTEALFDEYFADKGIETNFLVFDSGVEANQAFVTGSIGFCIDG